MRLVSSLILVLPLAFALLSGCSKPASQEQPKSLVIFHHGSPTPAIEAAEKAFKEKYPGTTVLREKDDALPNMRKVTDLGKLADLVYTDDYSIIPPVMFPKYANFWIRYAHDEMTIAYAANSKYAN
jgi:molybdate/tungstate transport system substrate-binding protein